MGKLFKKSLITLILVSSGVLFFHNNFVLAGSDQAGPFPFGCHARGNAVTGQGAVVDCPSSGGRVFNFPGFAGQVYKFVYDNIQNDSDPHPDVFLCLNNTGTMTSGYCGQIQSAGKQIDNDFGVIPLEDTQQYRFMVIHIRTEASATNDNDFEGLFTMYRRWVSIDDFTPSAQTISPGSQAVVSWNAQFTTPDNERRLQVIHPDGGVTEKQNVPESPSSYSVDLQDTDLGNYTLKLLFGGPSEDDGFHRVEKSVTVTVSPPATHKACVSNTCTTVSGAEADTCTSSPDSCGGGGGGPPATCSASFSPADGAPGSPLTLTLNLTNDSDGKAPYSCSSNPFGSGTINAGTNSLTRPANSQTCEFTASNANGSTKCNAGFTVSGGVPTLTGSITCNGQHPSCNISPGNAANFVWHSSGATQCHVLPYPSSPPWMGANGSATDPAPATRRVDLDCWDSKNDVVVDSVNVTVGTVKPPTPPPPTGGGSNPSITCNPQSVPYQTSANISWSSTGFSSCSVSPTGWSGTTGSQSTGNLGSDTTYTVTCKH